MIDAKLINKAKKKSKEIERIDCSWRRHVENLKENVFRVPFKGSYSAVIEKDHVLVEGYCGPLLLDRVYYQRRTYLLKNPLRYCPFRIYGVYDSKAGFEGFVARPEIGCHYLGLSHEGHEICTGEIEYANPRSLDSLKIVSLAIIDSFRMINLESLGTVILPDEYAKLKSILSNKDEGSAAKIGKLLSEGLIEEKAIL